MRSPELELTAQNANNNCEVICGISQRDKHIIDEGNERHKQFNSYRGLLFTLGENNKINFISSYS
jgi:hypothetical protein